MTSLRLPLLIISLVSAAALSGCTGVSADAYTTLSTSEAEQAIKTNLPDYMFDSVTCPTTIRNEKDFSFVCNGVSTNGATTQIDVTQPVSNGDLKFNTPKTDAVSLAVVRNFVGESLTGAGSNPTIDCGDGTNYPVDNGTEISCKVTTASGESKVFTVVAEVADGSVMVSFK